MPPLAPITSFWPEKKANARFVPTPPDPGIISFLKVNAHTSLYHNILSGIYRTTELSLEEWDWTQPDAVKMSPKLANSMFGIPEELVFDEPIHLGAAQLMHDRKIAELDREFVIGTGTTGAGRMIAGFGIQLVATALDPINLASMFVPVVGEARFARMVQSAGGSMLRARLKKGAIEGAVGAVMVEPFILLPAIQEQSNYGIGDSAINLGFGTVLGSIFQTGFGFLGDIPTIRRNRETKKLFNETQRSLDSARERVQQATPEEQDEMFKSAISDIVQDEPVAAPGEMIESTKGELSRSARFDAGEAREEALRELGFDVDQPDIYTHPNPEADGFDMPQVPDPKPNEPWFHGRAGAEVEFQADRAAFFARDPETANWFAENRRPVESGEDPTVFVANLDIKNAAREIDVKTAQVEFFARLMRENNLNPDNPDDLVELNRIVKELLSSELEGNPILSVDIQKTVPENLFGINPELEKLVKEVGVGEGIFPALDAVYMKQIQEILESKGFDGYVGAISVGFAEGRVSDFENVAIVWDTEQIQTPGRRPVKTDVGIKWADGRDVKLELDQRIDNLRKARVNAAVARKRRQFNRESEGIQQTQEHVRPVNAPEPMEFRDPDLNKQVAEIETEVALIEEDLRPTTTEFTDETITEQLLPEPLIKEPEVEISLDPNFRFGPGDLRNEVTRDALIERLNVLADTELNNAAREVATTEGIDFDAAMDVVMADPTAFDINVGTTIPLDETIVPALDELMRRGFDVNSFEGEASGISQFVLVLKDDWVVRLSFQEPDPDIAGITTRSVFQKKVGRMHIDVAEKVTPLNESNLSNLQKNQVRLALARTMREKGLRHADFHNQNIGVREDGTPVVLDKEDFKTDRLDEFLDTHETRFSEAIEDLRDEIQENFGEELDLNPEERDFIDDQMGEIPDAELNERALRAALDCLRGPQI